MKMSSAQMTASYLRELTEFTGAKTCSRHTGMVHIHDGLSVITIDRDLRILSRNGDALRLIRAGIVQGEYFRTENPIFDGKLRRWIYRQVSGCKGQELRLALKTATGDSLAFSITATHALKAEIQPLFVIVIRDQIQAIFYNICEITKGYNLTPAESKLLEFVCKGINTVEIGANLGISKTTARSHLQQIFTKTGVRRQGELIQFVLQFVPDIA